MRMMGALEDEVDDEEKRLEAGIEGCRSLMM